MAVFQGNWEEVIQKVRLHLVPSEQLLGSLVILCLHHVNLTLVRFGWMLPTFAEGITCCLSRKTPLGLLLNQTQRPGLASECLISFVGCLDSQTFQCGLIMFEQWTGSLEESVTHLPAGPVKLNNKKKKKIQESEGKKNSLL